MVAVVLILACICKLLDVGAEDMIEGLEKAGLSDYVTLISLSSLICGLLLLIPPFWKLGLLMSSAYWGGAIVAHLTYDDSVLMPAIFLGLLWVGAGLELASETISTKANIDASVNS